MRLVREAIAPPPGLREIDRVLECWRLTCYPEPSWWGRLWGAQNIPTERVLYLVQIGSGFWHEWPSRRHVPDCVLAELDAAENATVEPAALPVARVVRR